jgi:hypothetical protein
VQHRRFTPWQLVPRVTQFTFSMTAPCEKEGCDHGAARGTADTERRHDEGQDGETRVELRFGGGGNHNCSILVLFLMLSWAYIPA